MATFKYLDDNNPDGTILGQSAAAKIGFYNATASAQPAATAQSTVTSTTLTDCASTTITSVGSTSLTAIDVTRINAAISRAEEVRLIVSSMITRVEAMRVLQNQTRTDLVQLGLQKGSA